MAKEGLTDYFRNEKGKTWHQFFPDFQADELIEMHILNDEVQLKGELTPIGYSVIFQNWII